MSAALTISLDPSIQLGPLEIAWHGLMVAVGIGVGAWLASRFATERGLDTGPLFSLVYVIVAAGIVGAKLLYVAQHGGGLLESTGYSIYGGLVGAGVAAALWIGANGLEIRYLDVLAAGLPLGMAIGRVGDLINGEHYGPPSDLPWAIVYSHPDSLTPSSDIAYHPGGLYEILLSLLIFSVLWPLRGRFQRPLTLFWTTIGAYAAGRFAMFFWRDDASGGLAGFNSAQLESLVLLAVSAAGFIAARRLTRPGPASTQL